MATIRLGLLAVSRNVLNLSKVNFRSITGRRFYSIKPFPTEDGQCDKGLVLGLYQGDNKNEDPRFTSHAQDCNNKMNGQLFKLIKDCGLNGHLGEHRVFNGVCKDFASICVVGLGEEGVGYSELEALDMGMENVRVAAGVGARALRDQGCQTIHVDPMEYPEQAAEGSALSTWRYQENKVKEDRLLVPRLELYSSVETDAWTRGIFKADAQNLARTLTDAPSNQLTPSNFAQACVDALCPCGVTCEAHPNNWCQVNNLNTFLTVAKSSCEDPAFLELSYCGNLEEKPILLVGSGLTYNSGGLSQNSKCKPDYRASMAGGAVVAATIRAAAALCLPINLVGLVPCCENMLSGMSSRPGDIITSIDGKSIAIHDTNHAHHLIMADTLIYGQETHRPRLVIDVSTMTEQPRNGIGEGGAAAVVNSQYAWKQLRKASAISGDRIWLLPPFEYYTRKVTNFGDVDLSNKGSGKGSPCLGAAFIREFVPCIDWIHLDITGVAMKKKDVSVPYLENERMTGRPVRTLIQFLHQIACPEEAKRELK